MAPLPVVAATPLCSSSVRLPSLAIARPVMLALWALATYAYGPATSSQHAADWPVARAPVTVEMTPLVSSTEYELTVDRLAPPPDAFEKIAWPAASKANPKGVMPADGCALAGPATPWLTLNVSMTLVAFSATSRSLPSGVKEIWTGAGLAALSGCTDPEIGDSFVPETWKPLMSAASFLSPTLTTYTVLPDAVMLSGMTPPDATLESSVKLPSVFSDNIEMLLSPALTAKNRPCAGSKASPPCE